MKIIMPMAGEGKRFTMAGYSVHKPVIRTTYWKTGEKLPMVVCAARDLPGIEKDGSNLILIDRAFHKMQGVEEEIRQYFPECSFVTADKLTEGQACTCLVAKNEINNDSPLLIAGCDNGMVLDEHRFNQISDQAEVIAFTFRHNEIVNKNPNAYGWLAANEDGHIEQISVKKALSTTPVNDHAIVAVFWFRHGRDFVRASEKMIAENDRIHGEFYVDQVIRHAKELGLDTRIFEIERYIGWGTPEDYENYEKTIDYWKRFVSDKGFIPGEQDGKTHFL